MNLNLDDLLKFKPVSRIIYGYDPDVKPNDHCIWDSRWGCWEENDEHFRERLVQGRNQNESI